MLAAAPTGATELPEDDETDDSASSRLSSKLAFLLMRPLPITDGGTCGIESGSGMETELDESDEVGDSKYCISCDHKGRVGTYVGSPRESEL